MKLWKYKDYQEYVKSQVDGIYKHPTVRDNYNHQWFENEDIIFLKEQVISPYFSKINVIPKFGICHGAKLGKENVEFEKQTGINFIGTDISIDSSIDMKLIKWDFHDVKDEWIENVDIIYSNALDHSYNPELCLSQWISCLTDRGICIVEHTHCHLDSTATDPFGATLQEYCDLILSVGGKVLEKKRFIIFTRG